VRLDDLVDGSGRPTWIVIDLPSRSPVWWTWEKDWPAVTTVGVTTEEPSAAFHSPPMRRVA
jgi:hypothetical protein